MANYHNQPTLFGPYLALQFIWPNYIPKNAHIFIRNLTQTIPIESNQQVFGYAPLHTYAATGFDGPYKSSVINGSKILMKYHATGTFFFDPDHYGTGWNMSSMKKLLINDSMEFGIHTMPAYPTYDNYNLTSIRREFINITNMAESIGWNNYSFVWTTLGNGYAWQYNDFFWDHWSVVGRKMWGHWGAGWGGVSGNGSFGGSVNTWGAAQRGLSWIAYAHEVEANADPTHGVDYTFYDTLINTSVQKGIHVVGYMQYWIRYAAPWYVSGNVTKESGDKYLVSIQYQKFKFQNGFKVGVKMPSSSNVSIYDENTHTTVCDYKVYNWGIVFEAKEGHNYIIHTEEEIPEINTIQLSFIIIILIVLLFPMKKLKN